MNVTMREFDTSDADYEAWCAICNALNPDNVRTAEEMKDWEARREPRILVGKWFGVVDGEPVGVIEYSQMMWAYHPQKFSVYVGVVPAKQGAGIGQLLFDYLTEALAPHNPVSLRCNIRADWTRSVKFVACRGFAEDFRAWESRLDVTAFDPAPFAELRDKPLARGIIFKTAGQLKAEDSGFARKLWELDTELLLDVPSPEPITSLSFETFHRLFLESPSFLSEGVLFAVDGETNEYAGVSGVWKRQADNHLDTGLTGVRRTYRRMGIAMALKLRVIEYARSIGCPVIRTDNATTNRPMLSINEALGFEKQPVWISLTKTIEPNSSMKEGAV